MLLNTSQFLNSNIQLLHVFRIFAAHDFQNSRFKKIHSFKLPQPRISWVPEFRTFGFPEFRNSGFLKFHNYICIVSEFHSSTDFISPAVPEFNGISALELQLSLIPDFWAYAFPESQNSWFLKLQSSEVPQFWNCKVPKLRNFRIVEFRSSAVPKFQWYLNPEFRTFCFPDYWNFRRS